MSVGAAIGFIVGVTIFGGANIYVAKKLFLWLSSFVAHVNIKAFIWAYTIITISMILGFMRSFLPLPMFAKSILNYLSAYWMGIFIYLLLLFLAVDVFAFIGHTVKLLPRPLPQNIRFYLGLVVVFSTVVLVVYGTLNAMWLKYASYDVKVKEHIMPPNMKIVMVSDLHLGAPGSERNLEKVVMKINELEADLVCLAGDTFNDDYRAIRDSERASDLFASINATYGTYACLGNHDGGTYGEFVDFFERSGVRLLNDEYVLISDRLALFGRVDASPIGGFEGLKRKSAEEMEPLFAEISENMAVVVIDHNPGNIEEYGENVDLILSGHTHRGQIFPGNLMTGVMYTVHYGHYQRDAASPHVIVSSGAGTWAMPMRIGSDNEIVSITLR